MIVTFRTSNEEKEKIAIIFVDDKSSEYGLKTLFARVSNDFVTAYKNGEATDNDLMKIVEEQNK